MCAGETLEVWTGGSIPNGGHVAVLAVVVKGGFHSLTKYKWKFNGREERKYIQYCMQLKGAYLPVQLKSALRSSH